MARLVTNPACPKEQTPISAMLQIILSQAERTFCNSGAYTIRASARQLITDTYPCRSSPGSMVRMVGGNSLSLDRSEFGSHQEQDSLCQFVLKEFIWPTDALHPSSQSTLGIG